MKQWTEFHYKAAIGWFEIKGNHSVAVLILNSTLVL